MCAFACRIVVKLAQRSPRGKDKATKTMIVCLNDPNDDARNAAVQVLSQHVQRGDQYAIQELSKYRACRTGAEEVMCVSDRSCVSIVRATQELFKYFAYLCV